MCSCLHLMLFFRLQNYNNKFNWTNIIWLVVNSVVSATDGTTRYYQGNGHGSGILLIVIQDNL